MALIQLICSQIVFVVGDQFTGYVLLQMIMRVRFFFLVLFSASVYPYTLAKPVSRSATLVGSCTVWSMASSRTDRCRRTRRSAVETIASTRSSARPVPANMFPGRCSSTWSRPSSVILTSSCSPVPAASGVLSHFGGGPADKPSTAAPIDYFTVSTVKTCRVHNLPI